MNTFFKNFLLSITFLAVVAPSFVRAEDEGGAERHGDNNDCVLVAKKIKANKGFFESVCAEKIKSKKICTDDVVVNHCANVHSVCASDLCVSNVARINQICGLYRATAIFSMNTTYTLGSPVNFDLVLDDPNNNVTLAPFSYTAPVDGYYIAALQVDAIDLATADQILGIPVSNIAILVNGIVHRQLFSPFLAFHNQQFTNLTSILSLKAGDVVTSTYNVLIFNDITGLTTVNGTMTLEGNGSPANQTQFKIHYLSSDCERPECPPCTPSHCDNTCYDSCKPCH